MGYQEDIIRGLGKAYNETYLLPIDIASSRFVIFSDHYKGTRDEADDFKQCEASYLGALDYYLEQSFTLFILGDGEELWECRTHPVLEAYPNVLTREARFHEVGRYVRCYGNHDDEWSYPSVVKEHLSPFFHDLNVRQGIRLVIQQDGTSLGELLLVHGHQGTTFSDRLGWISKYAIRFLWRPLQRLLNIRTTTPATDWQLQHKHDIAMYNWAVSQKGLVLIAGHTHHPIFPTQMRAARLVEAFNELQKLSVSPVELEYSERTLAFAQAQAQPCYINTGCCCFSDGSITGVEVASKEIRLVRWRILEDVPQREVLDSANLPKLLAKVTEAGSLMPVKLERT